MPGTIEDGVWEIFNNAKKKVEVKKEKAVTVKPIKGMEGFLFGCDPERFIIDRKGRFVSASGIIPGTKNEPYKVKQGAVQLDGVAGEFNIDPAASWEEFNDNVETVMSEMKGFLPSGYKFSDEPVAFFDEDVWASISDSEKELGCTPDFNAWTGDVNPPPDGDENYAMRTASGHLHLGWTKGAALDDAQHLLNCFDVVKQLDWFLGAWSVRADPSPTRRLLYGKAGACRIKDYGTEYRVLSNFWLKDAKVRLEMWNRMQQALLDMSRYYVPENLPANYNKALIKSINTTTPNRSLENECRYPVVSAVREF